MALVYIYKGRGISKDVVIKNGSGATVTPGENDQIRARIGREGSLDTSPMLSVASNAATGNGSTFTKNSPQSGTNRLRLDDADTALIDPGVYTLAIDLMDNADGGDWKNVSRQVLSCEAT